MKLINRKELFDVIDAILPQVVEWRHRIHRYPELAGEEHQTAALVREALRTTAFTVLPPFLQTDVVALLSGPKPGRNVTLRADLDALPLTEQTDVPYRSTRPGLMHACGHDGHTAMLLGAALVLSSLQSRLNGSVRLVFQPGEEVKAMGRDLLAAGALKHPSPDAVFAIHDLSGYEVGTIISRPGPIMAAAGFFKIVILGRGGHGSHPELAVDPVVVGAELVTALQTIVARRLDPQAAAVVSVCRFAAGTNANVIPETAELEGTTRFFAAALGDRLPGLIEEMTAGICQAHGARYRFEYQLPFQPTVNHPDCVQLARQVTAELLGPEQWREMPQPSMGAEDFGYYLQQCPGALCDLGIGIDHPPIHSPNFDFDDRALRAGIALHCGLALTVLE